MSKSSPSTPILKIAAGNAESDDNANLDTKSLAAAEEELDADEIEYRRLRRDLPGIKGAAAQGIVSVAVSKAPTKNEFFRTHATFRPEVEICNVEVGMERHFFAVDTSMEVPLRGIGVDYTKHILYLTVSPRGAVHVIPISCSADNEYTRTKEIGLLEGIKQWVRLYTDREDKAYRVFPAPAGRFDEPIWPP